MNSIVVAKFGGTSMANAAAMKKSADIVYKNPKIKLIVVSATAGTSNAMIEIYNCLCSGDKDQAQELLKSLEHKHILIAKDLFESAQLLTSKNSCDSTEFSKETQEYKALHTLLKKMHIIASFLAEAIDGKNSKEIAKQLDKFLSLGEELSSCLFVMTLRIQNVNCEFFDVQKVLITSNHFGKAEPILDEIGKRTELFLKPLLSTETVQVVQGFVGTTQLGETTTLGRGGSDFSAALLAEALQADELQIWTDVPGIMTMDPTLVPDAKIIPQMNFAVAAELANFGAKVLHPATLWPAVRQNIKTFVGSTFTPQLGGTWIYPENETIKPTQAIALRKKQTLITINSLRMLNAHGFLARLFGILAANQLSVDLVTTSEVSVALTIDQDSLGSSGEGIGKYSKMFDELKEFCEVIIEQGLTLVAIIGTGLIKTPKLNARIFNSIADFNVRLICHGASQHNLCFLVKKDDAIEIAQRLHHEFIENHPACHPYSHINERSNEPWS